MTYIGEDPDIKVLCEDNCDKTKIVRLIFLHHDHDLLRADNAMKLEIGFACVDCDIYFGSPLSRVKQSSGSTFVDNFFQKLISAKDAKSIRALVSEYPEFLKKLEKVKCML